MNMTAGLQLTVDAKQDQILLKVRTRDEFNREWSAVQRRLAPVERQVTEFGAQRKEWFISGVCDVCGGPAKFQLDWQYSDHVTLNFRERLVCGRCHLSNRQRFAYKLLQDYAAAQSGRCPTVYLYEQVTPFFAHARRHLRARVFGSEYLGCEAKAGEVINGLRHEDALNLSFADQSLDVLMSNDVLEHVPDYQRALVESWRVLAPGGKLIFSVPFFRDRLRTVQRARMTSAGIEKLFPEQYHGNPVSAQGSLVFFDFGWDLLGACLQAGFADAYVLVYHSLLHGYLGEGGQLLFVADRA
jgi:SAM-dependent methyltransferase